jgi:hypothetical protein
MIAAVDFCKQEINMRTVLAVATIGLTIVGYFPGPAAALPRDCFAEEISCEVALTGTMQKKAVTSICSSRMTSCWADNRRNGYTGNDQYGPNDPDEKKGASKEPEKKKPTDWKIKVGSPPHIANPTKSGSNGSNAQLGIKATTPTTAPAPATSSALTLPPKPATVSNEAIAKRVGAGRL